MVFNFLGKGISALGGIAGVGGKQGRLKTLQAADFATTATACITTDYTKIGTYTVQAQTEVAVGFGNAREPDNQGYIYVVSKNDHDAALEGMLRIMVANSEETRLHKVFEERTDVLSGSATLRTQKVPLPEVTAYGALGRRPREDDKIQLWLKVDSAENFSPTISTVYVPVTIYA